MKLRLIPVALSILLSACHSDSIVDGSDTRNQNLIAERGQTVFITLGNVGPAVYESPPGISSSAVSYIGVEVVPPYTPAGPNQRFSFKAEKTGEAVVRFRRVLGESVVAVVVDTIRVK